MTEFKAGDKVRVIDRTGYTLGEWIGVEGIYVGAGQYGYNHKITVTKAPTGYEGTRKPVGSEATVSGLELIKEEKPFTFADIQVGDTVRRTEVTETGFKTVSEGVVVELDSYYAETADCENIVASKYDNNKQVTLELLNRPEPEPEAEQEPEAEPEPTLLQNTKIGDRLVIPQTLDGWYKVYTKTKDNEWDTLVIRPEGAYAGYTWPTESLEQEIERLGNHTLISA